MREMHERSLSVAWPLRSRERDEPLVVLAKVRVFFSPRVSHFLKVRTAELLAPRKYYEMCQL